MLNVGVFTVIRVLKAKFNQNSSVADPVHFFGSGSTDPVFKIQIRIRLTQRRPDPTGSASYLDMFFMFSKINNCCMAFLYLI